MAIEETGTVLSSVLKLTIEVLDLHQREVALKSFLKTPLITKRNRSETLRPKIWNFETLRL
jgi:hypothetical protein